MSGLLETVSKNRKKGRPPGILSEPGQEYIAKMAAEDQHVTRRTLQDVAFRVRAMGVIGRSPDPKRYKWLVDLEAIKTQSKSERGQERSWRPGILSALGRMENDEMLLSCAAELCDMKITTREAVRLLLVVRRSFAKECSADQ